MTPDITPPAEPCPECGASVYMLTCRVGVGYQWTCSGCGKHYPAVPAETSER